MHFIQEQLQNPSNLIYLRIQITIEHNVCYVYDVNLISFDLSALPRVYCFHLDSISFLKKITRYFHIDAIIRGCLQSSHLLTHVSSVFCDDI